MQSYTKENLEEIRQRINDIAIKSGRDSSSIKLLAVSKGFPVKIILEAYNCGQRCFGENRVQELESKASLLPKDIEWHLIGHLQGNKAVKAIEYASWIHSVDSETLLHRLDRLAQEKNKIPKILLEVNISGEENKYGLTPEAVEACARTAKACQNLKFVGLMTMAPYNVDEKQLSEIFSKLRMLRDNLEEKLEIQLQELSMGMSSDYPIAIAEGATIVRIGTAIFGNRLIRN